MLNVNNVMLSVLVRKNFGSDRVRDPASRSAARAFLLATVLGAALVAASTSAQAKVTVHDYSYNADGALTAISTQVDDQAPTTTYLIWDDFTPDAEDPSTGAVVVGDGRLVGYGPNPASGRLTARFTFDPRDRLLGYSGDAGDETYDYHANGKLVTASAGGDLRRFYFDVAENANVTNIFEQGSGLTSAYLGNNRFLSDGSEQILLRPRKDMACTYDSASQTLQSYAYDAFGAPPDTDEPSGTYDLRDNPFRYAGEYRDPIWGGYYLRARWYAPELPVFISRDPMPYLNRYAYGNGSPVMNADPSGFGPDGLRRFLAKMNRGTGGHFARIFLAPLLAPLQIAAYPDQFWNAVKANKGGIDVFLALGIVSELGGGYVDAVFAGLTRLGVRYGARFLSDSVIGVASSITAGAHRGFGHFDWNAFGQGMEYSANAFLMRGFTGFNVRSGFQFSGSDAAELFEELRNAPDSTALIFRQRVGTGGSTNSLASMEGSTGGLVGGNAGFDKPFSQAVHLSAYHERLIAVTKRGVLTNEAFSTGVVVRMRSFAGLSFDQVKTGLANSLADGKVELVGRVDNFGGGDTAAQQAFRSNPYNVRVARNDTGRALATRGGPASKFNLINNNCQYHAYAVLKDMGLR